MTTFQSVTIILLIGLTACNSGIKKLENTATIDKTEKNQRNAEHFSKSGDLYKSTPQQIEEERKQDIADSINMIRTLELALKIVEKQKIKDNFSLNTDTLSIRYGYIFSSSVKHLIVKRTFQYVVNADIYKLKNNQFIKVCSKEMAPLAYIGDTIKDVNGDGRVDYLFHWYPMSGCCLRNIYDVYLQKPNGDFANEQEFINPNFFPKEKTIRGRCYGRSAPLYKYKWNGYKVDTIEYIYFPDKTNENRFIRRKRENEKEKGEILKHLPSEYKKIGS